MRSFVKSLHWTTASPWPQASRDNLRPCLSHCRFKATLPIRVQPAASEQHRDLDSFLAYAQRTGLKESSPVFKGTRFEYLVAMTLSRLGFELQRTGRSNDLGIDLVGTWDLPQREAQGPMRVLVQCKASPPTPAMVRELEGAYVGAPAGWRDNQVLAMLAVSHSATAGVRAAVQRSRCPMAAVNITREGSVQQFIWNAVANQIGLDALGVTLQYSNSSDKQAAGSVASCVALTWQGQPWRTSRRPSQRNVHK